ncbi:hypothetical protein FGG79_07250 [Bacillus sp. BHET2]|uniref:hypothetical protein n=1 Tax=Bacillus sp. BHET2 TaxID=2583818 RepID=UPI00110E83BC|nr:hypothetical protein [Bacillus sp. BHET2]TMU87898.1 hypothetical protein FGG79_07250 [Bacillus sp. BHET2]
MIWVFLCIVLGLSVMYMIGGRSEGKDIQTKDSDSFIVTATLSALAAHGMISLAQEKEWEAFTLIDLQHALLVHGVVDEGEWIQILTDHLDNDTAFIESKNMDMG